VLPTPGTAFLTPASQDAAPDPSDQGTEPIQAGAVAGYGVIVEPSLDNCSQPPAHVGHREVHATHELGFDRLQLRAHALGDRLSLDRKRSLPRRPAVVREAEEVERFRLAQTTLGSTFRRKTAELDQACFVRVQFQAELGKSPPKLLEAALGVGTVLEPHDEIIRVTNDDDVALRV